MNQCRYEVPKKMKHLKHYDLGPKLFPVLSKIVRGIQVSTLAQALLSDMFQTIDAHPSSLIAHLYLGIALTGKRGMVNSGDDRTLGNELFSLICEIF